MGSMTAAILILEYNEDMKYILSESLADRSILSTIKMKNIILLKTYMFVTQYLFYFYYLK